MDRGLIAIATITVDASREKVWESLIDPEAIKSYMFGTQVASDWREGSPITWRGRWHGRVYQDKGVILRFQRARMLQYSHFSPLAGLPDTPENYHTVTITLSTDGRHTRLALAQDNNATKEERAKSQKNWDSILTRLKAHVEGRDHAEAHLNRLIEVDA